MAETYCPTCDAVIPPGDTSRDGDRVVHVAPDGSFTHELTVGQVGG